MPSCNKTHDVPPDPRFRRQFQKGGKLRSECRLSESEASPEGRVPQAELKLEGSNPYVRPKQADGADA